jgi:competence protein ComEC
LGILIGQRTTLPDSLNNELSKVGLTHIIAVSGYNLTIIVQLVHRLVKKRSKYQATIITLALIGLFVVVTGSSASIIRAAWVSGLSLAAWYYGRTFRPVVLILLTAALTAGWFPPYLWSDVGWHLSFLAFAGVLIVAPQIQARFLKTKPRLITQLLLETAAAQIMTLPLILYIFGRLSLVALLANMLVVWLIPLAMLLTVVAGLAGMLVPMVAGWVAWPATILLAYILELVGLLARLPYASVGISITAWHMVLSYACIVFIVYVWWQKGHPSGKLKVLTEPIFQD